MTYPVHAVERKWRAAWQQSNCFRAPDQPAGEKFFNFDSGPFPNGPLHMGHVRTYVLGDVVARVQRLLGKSVLYCTEWDAFGLPNELGAVDAGTSPAEFTAANIARMRDGLQRLGISYDWSRIKSTCDPAYVRTTQKLFIELWRRGLVYRKNSHVLWCPSCQTSLSQMQVDDGGCWRCQSRVESRSMPQWFAATSNYSDRLHDGIAQLSSWSDTGKRLLRRGLQAKESGRDDGQATVDWNLSRQRAWGTPIPVVHCQKCGPVADGRPPISSVSNGKQRSLPCPDCGGVAEQDPDTLDCFFDDSWSYLSCLAPLDFETFPDPNAFSNWMPVDHFHSGFDTFAYLNLYRFVGMFLYDCGVLSGEEPIRRYDGHDMVTSAGRKMSKHLGNVIDVDGLLVRHGADALRIAVLWAAAPSKPVDWENKLLERAQTFIDRAWKVIAMAEPAIAGAAGKSDGGATRAATRLATNLRASWRMVRQFIEEYRPNAAVEEVYNCLTQLGEFLRPRVGSGRLSPDDARLIGRLLRELAVVLSPFAPFVAEEIGTKTGLRSLVATSKWPESGHDFGAE